MVRKSFLKCGISNALDGTQDDELYQDDDETTKCETTSDNDDDYTADADFTQEQYNERFDETDDHERLQFFWLMYFFFLSVKWLLYINCGKLPV